MPCRFATIDFSTTSSPSCCVLEDDDLFPGGTGSQRVLFGFDGADNSGACEELKFVRGTKLSSSDLSTE